MRLRNLLVVIPVLALFTMVPGKAFAMPPTQTTVDLTGTFTLPPSFTGCPFTITASQSGTGYVTTFYDQAGNVTDIFTRTPGLTVTYYSQSGTAYTSNSPAPTHVDATNNTITYDGLQAHIVIPGTGLIGAATGEVVFNMQTGALLVSDGQTTLLMPFSPEVCTLLAQ